MGTTHTVTGVGGYLKSQDPQVQIIGLRPAQGSNIPGIRHWTPAYQLCIFRPDLVDQVLNTEQCDA